MSSTVLVRYGVVGETARFQSAEDASFERGCRVVVRTHRGLELGTVLGQISAERSSAEHNTIEGNIAEGNRGDNDSPSDTSEPKTQSSNNLSENTSAVVGRASRDDEDNFLRLSVECEEQFDQWCSRIVEWKLDLELLDLERTLDGGKLVLYVLNNRGPDCTKLALQAAAAGLGIIEVQPVDADGLVQVEQSGGGCATGGCGCKV